MIDDVARKIKSYEPRSLNLISIGFGYFLFENILK
jgi:hypothetical protein